MNFNFTRPTDDDRETNPRAVPGIQSDSPQTIVSAYDRTNGLLVAAITTIGILVLILFAFWLTMGENSNSVGGCIFKLPIRIDLDDNRLDSELAVVNADSFPETKQPDLDRQLTLVQHIASSVQARNPKSGSGKFEGDGPGDERRDTPTSRLARAQWSLSYQAKSMSNYARQLDFFDIQIGVVDAESSKIDLLSNLAGARQVTQTTRAKMSATLRFTNYRHQFKRWEAKFAEKSSIPKARQLKCQFIPNQLRNLMAQLETDAAVKAGETVANISKTRFQVVPDGDNFQLVVADIEFSKSADD